MSKLLFALFVKLLTSPILLLAQVEISVGDTSKIKAHHIAKVSGQTRDGFTMIEYRTPDEAANTRTKTEEIKLARQQMGGELQFYIGRKDTVEREFTILVKKDEAQITRHSFRHPWSPFFGGSKKSPWDQTVRTGMGKEIAYPFDVFFMEEGEETIHFRIID